MIEKRERVKSTPISVRFLLWLEIVFRRPAFAAVYVLALLSIGVSSGLYTAESYKSRYEQLGQDQYLQLVDPFHANNPASR